MTDVSRYFRKSEDTLCTEIGFVDILFLQDKLL